MPLIGLSRSTLERPGEMHLQAFVYIDTAIAHARLAGIPASRVDVYAFFNNDMGGHAPRDAVRLRALLTAAPLDDSALA